MEIQRSDYLFCEDCEMIVDLWKYDTIDDTGHGECKTRDLSMSEFIESVQECADCGCFEEPVLILLR